MKVVSGTWPTLYHVAAQVLGDASQAVRIAQQNGLTDFWLSGPVTLQVPDADPSSGGVPSQ